MKRTIIALAAIGTLQSCEKCYQCTVTVTQYGNSITPASSGSSVQQHCGTRKEIEEIQRSGNFTSTGSSGGVTIVQKTTTVCRQK